MVIFEGKVYFNSLFAVYVQIQFNLFHCIVSCSINKKLTTGVGTRTNLWKWIDHFCSPWNLLWSSLILCLFGNSSSSCGRSSCRHEFGFLELFAFSCAVMAWFVSSGLRVQLLLDGVWRSTTLLLPAHPLTITHTWQNFWKVPPRVWNLSGKGREWNQKSIFLSKVPGDGSCHRGLWRAAC